MPACRLDLIVGNALLARSGRETVRVCLGGRLGRRKGGQRLVRHEDLHDFVTLANYNGPVWLFVPGGSLETLNRTAYFQAFLRQNSAMGLKMEVTRAKSKWSC